MTTVNNESMSSMEWTRIWPYIWYCNPVPELMYIITTKSKDKQKNQTFLASVGEIISKEVSWSELEFKMDSNFFPEITTLTLESAFRNCAADFAFKTMIHSVNE